MGIRKGNEAVTPEANRQVVNRDGPTSRFGGPCRDVSVVSCLASCRASCGQKNFPTNGTQNFFITIKQTELQWLLGSRGRICIGLEQIGRENSKHLEVLVKLLSYLSTNLPLTDHNDSFCRFKTLFQARRVGLKTRRFTTASCRDTS